MSLMQVGLVDTTGEKIDAGLLQAAAAALNIQVNRDLSQFWNVKASVHYLPSASKIPAGVWPVFLVKSLPPGEGGFHMDKHNQPYAKVIASADSDEWTVDASHETIEMLVDPYGNRLQNSTSIEIKNGKIQDGTGEFAYLVEACDPCEADKYTYAIQGVTVSDFLTPHFYDPLVTSGTRYSYTGAIKAPRQILPGGYISWVNQEKDELQQILWVDPDSPPTLKTWPVPKGLSLRLWVDAQMHNKYGKPTVRTEKGPELSASLVKRHAAKRASMDRVAEARAKLY
jgi:hypothetical protein